MLTRVVTAGVALAAPLLTISCVGGTGMADAGSAPVDEGDSPPIDIAMDSLDVPADPIDTSPPLRLNTKCPSAPWTSPSMWALT